MFKKQYHYYYVIWVWGNVKMKILQVVPHYLPYMGGQEIYVHNLSKKLVEMGHEVQIFTSNYPKTYSSEHMDGILVERKDIIARPLRNPLSFGFFKLKDIVDDFDVVHAHNLYAFSSLLTAHNKKKKSFPMVLTSHGKLNFGVNYKDAMVKIYKEKIGTHILERADIITALSESQGNSIAEIDPNLSDKIRIIPNAIDIDFFNLLDLNSQKKEQEDFTFLYVGQMIKRKGIGWLIKAIDIIKSENNNIKLILVGDGAHKKHFEKMVNNLNLTDYVEFKGKITDQIELASFYKSADVFVLPSLSEGLPTVLLEAMYFGLPVVATDILGIKEYFQDYAALVPPEDQKRLAEAMINLFDEDELKKAEKLSKKAKKIIETQYSWDGVAKEYESLYRNLV